MPRHRDLLSEPVRPEQISVDEPPAAVLFDDVPRLSVVLDAVESFHRAVSVTLFDSALRFGGVAVSTAITA